MSGKKKEKNDSGGKVADTFESQGVNNVGEIQDKKARGSSIHEKLPALMLCSSCCKKKKKPEQSDEADKDKEAGEEQKEEAAQANAPN